MEPNLQLLFRTDKRNPSFSVYRDVGKKEVQVYLGMELFETIPENRDHPEFKFLLVRLYRNGIRGTALKDAFGVDTKTLRRWTAAVRSGDAEQMVCVLAGRHHRRKLTPEILAYLQMRFDAIYAQTPAVYNQKLRTEVLEVFKVKLSTESIRQVCRPFKQRMKERGALDSSKRACSCEAQSVAVVTTEVLPPEKELMKTATRAPDRKFMPVFEVQTADKPSPSVRLMHHLGVLLLGPILLAMDRIHTTGGWILKQWLATLLLGAVNIEQTKLLDLDDLGEILGRTLLPPRLQRGELGRLAENNQVAMDLLRWNASQVEATTQTDFYYDPHAKPYSGELKILKGWCSAKHFADKVLFMDFIHTSRAQPIYVEYTDNYEDLRQRFIPIIKQFRSTLKFPAEAVLSFVIDRGIYGQEIFDALRENPALHFITWEKNYQAINWDSKLSTGTFIMTRTRNNSKDLKYYRFEYFDQPWEKNPKLRQLRVKATNPNNQTIELGVLTDDLSRCAREIILLIFRRWVQENDFKYLEKHFGINQITSYASIPYSKLKDQLVERQTQSGTYRALQKQKRQLDADLKKQLLGEHRKPNTNKQRVEKIMLLDQQVVELNLKIQKTQKEVSRSEQLIQDNYLRLNTANKQIMDALKLIARNAFYRAFQPFKKLYDNFRDDHDLFRNLICSDGLLIQQNKQAVDVLLFPEAHYPPALKQIVTELLEQINQSQPVMPDGSNRKIRFSLGQKRELDLRSSTFPPRGEY